MSKKNRNNKRNVDKDTVVDEVDVSESVELVEEASKESSGLSESNYREDTEDASQQVTNDNIDNIGSSESVETNDAVESKSLVEKPVKKKHDLASLMSELEGKLTSRELREWTYSSLVEFKETGNRVELSKRNNYKHSRTRPLDPSKWSVEELMDWLEGDVEGHRNTRKEAILEEIYLRWKIPSNFTEEAVYDLVINHKEPEATTNGVLKEDRRRKEAKLTDLTYTELCSIYIGEIESSYSKSEVKRRIMLISRILDDDLFESNIQRFKEGNKHMSSLSDQLIGVLESRKELYRKYGNRVTDEQLATNTVSFYNTLRTVTKANYAEFAETWRTLLKFVDTNYTGVFHPSQIRRGWPILNLSSGNVQALDRLLVLILTTRVPATRRQDVRQLQMDYILENISNQVERDNITSFYTED